MNICVSMCYTGNREAVVTGDEALINGHHSVFSPSGKMYRYVCI